MTEWQKFLAKKMNEDVDKKANDLLKRNPNALVTVASPKNKKKAAIFARKLPTLSKQLNTDTNTAAELLDIANKSGLTDD